MYACFDQPDLKATFTLHGDRAGDWQVRLQQAAGRAEQAGDRASSAGTSPPTPRMSTYITALVAGPYHAVARPSTTASRSACSAAQSLARVPRRRRALRDHQAGLRLLPRAFGVPLPVRQVRPALRARSSTPARWRTPARVTFLEDYVFRSQGHRRRRRARAPRRSCTRWRTCGSATSSPCAGGTTCGSTSRSPTYSLDARAGRRPPAGPNAWTTFANAEKTWAYRQDQLPSTHPIAADIVDMEAVEANFDGITYAKGASVLKQLVAWVGQRRRSSPALRALLRRARLGQHHAARPARRARGGVSGRDLPAWSKEWLETAGVNTLRPRVRDRRRGPFTVVRRAAGGAGRRTRRCARTGSRSACTTAPPTGWSARDAGRARRRRRAHRGARAASAQRQPDLVLVNDDDLTYAKIRLDERSLRDR